MNDSCVISVTFSHSWVYQPLLPVCICRTKTSVWFLTLQHHWCLHSNQTICKSSSVPVWKVTSHAVVTMKYSLVVVTPREWDKSRTSWYGGNIKEVFYANMHRTMPPNLFSYLRWTDTLNAHFMTREVVWVQLSLPPPWELALLSVALLVGVLG